MTSSPSRRARQRKPSHLGSILPALALWQLGGKQRLHRRGTVVALRHLPTIARGLQSFPLRAIGSCYAAGPMGRTIMAFDPNAATARYIDSLGPAALQKAHDYTVGKEWMLLWALIVAALVTWLIVRSGLLDRLGAQVWRKAAEPSRLPDRPVFFIVSAMLTLPWTLYADYFREKSYGRTSQPLGDYLGQRRLRLDLRRGRRPVHDGRLLADAAYGKALVAMVRSADCGRLAFLILLAPVLIEPLFNKYQPVPPGQVRDAVVTWRRGRAFRRTSLHVQRLAPVEQLHRQCRRRRKHGPGRNLRRRAQVCLARRGPRRDRS